MIGACADAPGSSADAADRRELLARLRAVVEAKDAEIAVLREQCRRLELMVAELERRLGSDSTNSGIPPSKDPIGARERRKAERARERRSSERQRRKDRKRGGQPGIPGQGCRGTRTRASGPGCRRRRSARVAGPG
jgi:transposase